MVESPDQQSLAHSVSHKFEERENQIPTVQGKPAVSQPGVTPGENTTPSTPEISADQQPASDRPRQSNSISRSANLQSSSGQQYASPPSASQQLGRLEVSPSGISPEPMPGNGRTQPQTGDISSESTLTDGILQLQRENISSGSALGVQVSQPQPEDISLTPGESARPGDEAKNNHEEMVEPPPAIAPREKASTSSEQGQPLNPGITLQRPGSAMTGQVPAIPGTPSRTSPGRQPAISSESGFQDASPQMSVQSAEQLDESASVQLAPGVEQSGPSRGLGNVPLSRLRQSAGQISAQGPSLPSRPGQQWTDTGENPQSSVPELPNSPEALVPWEAVAAISGQTTESLEEKAVNAVNKERATGSPSIPPQDTNNPMPSSQRSNVQPRVIQRQAAPAGSSPGPQNAGQAGTPASHPQPGRPGLSQPQGMTERPAFAVLNAQDEGESTFQSVPSARFRSNPTLRPGSGQTQGSEQALSDHEPEHFASSSHSVPQSSAVGSGDYSHSSHSNEGITARRAFNQEQPVTPPEPGAASPLEKRDSQQHVAQSQPDPLNSLSDSLPSQEGENKSLPPYKRGRLGLGDNSSGPGQMLEAVSSTPEVSQEGVRGGRPGERFGNPGSPSLSQAVPQPHSHRALSSKNLPIAMDKPIQRQTAAPAAAPAAPAGGGTGRAVPGPALWFLQGGPAPPGCSLASRGIW